MFNNDILYINLNINTDNYGVVVRGVVESWWSGGVVVESGGVIVDGGGVVLAEWWSGGVVGL